MVQSDLWVERWRPQVLGDYVWSSQAQHDQVSGWVREGKIPHILMVGTPGVGKCLGPDESIRIKVDLDLLPLNIRRKIMQRL